MTLYISHWGKPFEVDVSTKRSSPYVKFKMADTKLRKFEFGLQNAAFLCFKPVLRITQVQKWNRKCSMFCGNKLTKQMKQFKNKTCTELWINEVRNGPTCFSPFRPKLNHYLLTFRLYLISLSTYTVSS